MDYIRSKIQKRLSFLSASGNEKENDLRTFSQIQVEELLIFILGYLWNKNINNIDTDSKEYVFQGIIKPTIGHIINLCRALDVDKEVFCNKRINETFEKYPNLRNEKIGHGFIWGDETYDLINTLNELYSSIVTAKSKIFAKDIDFVYVNSITNNTYKGIIYKSNGNEYAPWFCPKDVYDFEINNFYGCCDVSDYFKLSPFLEIIDENDIWIFQSIEEKLLGKVRYNNIFSRSGVKFREWDEFCQLSVENDGIRRRCPNGSIINIFDNNYRKYIDVGIKQKIKKFLIENRASVCATVWGHGGVGKTATIQSVCDDFSNDTKKIFDYIIFLTAKDRYYNYYTGAIQQLTDRVDSLEGIIANINKVIIGQESIDQNHIIDYQGKIFIVIDDFETFPLEERNKIDDFIKKLDINHHKIVVTTRINYILGEEIQTNELSETETYKFLKQVIENEIPEININFIENELKANDYITQIYKITSGRPLFIFQYAFVLSTKGSVTESLKYNIKESQSAVNFLYGRLYEGLSKSAKDVFVVISILVNSDDLSNVLEKIKYILNLEHDSDTFNFAVRELVKLKIIKVDDDNKFFEVYSKEILQIMSDYFRNKDDIFKKICIQRFNQVNKDKSLDNEHSLLINANSSRLAKNEEEVINNYRQILNRTNSKDEIKLQAILNLAAYLVDRGKKEIALRQLDEYSYIFQSNGIFIKMYTTYYWANGTNDQKEKAIEILLNYFSKGFSFDTDINLEIAGILLTYRSIHILSKWQELKEKRKFNEISVPDFSATRQKQIQICTDIHNKIGQPLYSFIVTKKFDEMYSGARQNIIAGLYQFVEICVRLQKFDLAKKICDYIFNCAPKHYHNQFKIKSDWIDYILNKGKPNIKANNIKKQQNNVSEFGEKLKGAINIKK